MNQSGYLSSSKFRLQRKLLMGLVLGLFIGVELAVGSNFLMKYPFLVAVPIMPFLFLRLSSRLVQAIPLIVFCMVGVRVGLSTGTASKLPISMLLALLCMGLWLVKMALDRDIHFERSKYNTPALVFIGVVIISYFWSHFFLDPQVIINSKFLPVQIGTIVVTMVSVFLPVLCMNLVKDTGIVKVSFWITVCASLFYLPFYIFEYYNPASRSVDSEAITLLTLSRLINAGGLYPMWICCLTLGLLLFARDLKNWQRWILVAVLLGWFFRLFVLTLVRISAWVPAVVGMLIILFLKSRKWFCIFLVVATILIALNYDKLYAATVGEKEKEGTLAGETSRSSLLGQAFNVSQDHLILGTGPAGYANYYLTYYRDHALSTHNNYLDMLLQYGLVGLGTFLWLCVTSIKEVWNSSRKQKPATFEQGFTIGAFGAAVGMMPAMWLGDWVIPFAYNQTIFGFNYTGYNWFFIGLVLALGNIQTKKEKE